jgi:hypothetical protein
LKLFYAAVNSSALKRNSFVAASTDDYDTPVSWVNRLEYFSVQGKYFYRATVTTNVFLIQRTRRLMLLFYSHEGKCISNFFSSRSTVDFDKNETPETDFYICHDIFV